MSRFIKTLCATALGICLLSASASAQDMPTADLLSGYLSRGELTKGEADFARRAPDAQNIAALGMLRFVRAVEKLGQGLHRYGLQPPNGLPMMPILRMPVPLNPNPETLTYEKLRAVYATFANDLAAADATLQKLPAGPVKLPVNLLAVRLDLNADGVATDAESLGSIVASLAMRPTARDVPARPWEVAFDRADTIWLRGYTHVLSAFLEFALAYDWHETYDAAAHLFFAGARASSAISAPVDMLFGRDDRIADVIALVHLIHWPVAEPARLLKAREHLKAVVTLSRENWKEILAETDDDREWIPGPQQKNSAFPGLTVTQERVDGWLRALDAFDEVLDGKRLVPHWRYKAGVDFNAIFTSPRPFDLVLWITGHAAIPYLKDGPVMSKADWAQWERIFGGQFLTYALWFN